MNSYALLALLAVCLALWGFGLWRRGFFGPGTLPVERRAYYLRVVLFFVSIFVVEGPLQRYRTGIGEVAYVAAAAAILALFFGIGLLAAKLMLKPHVTGEP